MGHRHGRKRLGTRVYDASASLFFKVDGVGDDDAAAVAERILSQIKLPIRKDTPGLAGEISLVLDGVEDPSDD